MLSRKFLLSGFMILMFSLAASGQSVSRESGIADFRSGAYQSAIESLSQVVISDKKDNGAWAYLGASHLKMGNEKEARKAFAKIKSGKKYDDGPFEIDFKIVSKGRARYNEQARQEGVTGTVSLVVEFGSDGKIGFVFPYRQLPFGLTEECVKAARLIKFDPAVADSKAVTVVRTVEYSFNIF